MSTRIRFFLDVDTDDRTTALERRDEIITKLGELGIRVSMTDDGTDVYLVDVGIPTISERIAGGNMRLDDK